MGGEKYVAQEKLSVVHFDQEKIATQFSIYDLGGAVDVHVDPANPALHAMEPGTVGPFIRTPATKLGDVKIKEMPKGPAQTGM